MDTKKTRKSYPTQRKLEVVNHAEKYGNASAAKEFETDESIRLSLKFCDFF